LDIVSIENEVDKLIANMNSKTIYLVLITKALYNCGTKTSEFTKWMLEISLYIDIV